MDEVSTLSLDKIDVSRPELFHNDTWQPWFARLRKEAPVHFQADSVNGPFWSVTSHELIKEVDSNNAVFSSSSEFGGIAIVDPGSGKVQRSVPIAGLPEDMRLSGLLSRFDEEKDFNNSSFAKPFKYGNMALQIGIGAALLKDGLGK